MGIVEIGQAVPREEDPVLLRGEGTFLADFSLPGMTHGVVVRSPHAHAHIRAINLEAALESPGVVTILTAEDYKADGIGRMPVLTPPLPGVDMDGMFKTERIPLADGKVRYVGDPVAFVVAETLAQAKDAAELLDIEYEALPSNVNTTRVRDGETPDVWDENPGNRCFLCEVGDKDATDAAFAAAAHVVKHRLIVNRVSANTIEGRGAIADYNKDDGRCTVYAGTQGSYGLRQQLAAMFDEEPATKFRVITGHVGGSFGMKGAFHPEIAMATWTSRRINRPVKWEAERSEGLIADFHGRDKVTDAELAFDADGNILGLRVDTTANMGAYMSPMSMFHTTGSSTGLVGVYKTPAMRLRVEGKFTNTSPTAPYRGANRPDTCYIIERMMDIAAAELNIDRVELRRRNMIAADGFPHKTPLGPSYDCGDFVRNMDDALAAIDYAGFEKRRDAAKARGKLLGLGLANNIENAAPPGTEHVDIKFDASGQVQVFAGSTDQGQGHVTMYIQLLCDRLGMRPDQVRVFEGDTDQQAMGGGTGGSKVSALGGGAMATAADMVVEEGKLIAAHLLEAAIADTEFDDGVYRVAGTDKTVGLAEVVEASFDPARQPPGRKPGLSVSASYETKAPNFPNGCHVCEVEVDQETGGVKLVNYVGVNDVGRVINQLILEGQICGGIVQGAAQAMMEAIAYDDETGQLLSGSFLDYAMPRGNDFCPISLADNPTYTETNRLGVKGGGELGTACAMTTVVSAVMDALSPLGITHLDMPLSGGKVWAAIQGAGGG